MYVYVYMYDSDVGFFDGVRACVRRAWYDSVSLFLSLSSVFLVSFFRCAVQFNSILFWSILFYILFRPSLDSDLLDLWGS